MLLVGRFVLAPDGHDDESLASLVNLVEHPMVPAHPDAELVLPAGHPAIAARPRVLLEIQDRPRHTKKCPILQLEEFPLRGAPEENPKHGAS